MGICWLNRAKHAHLETLHEFHGPRGSIRRDMNGFCLVQEAFKDGERVSGGLSRGGAIQKIDVAETRDVSMMEQGRLWAEYCSP